MCRREREKEREKERKRKHLLLRIGITYVYYDVERATVPLWNSHPSLGRKRGREREEEEGDD